MHSHKVDEELGLLDSHDTSLNTTGKEKSLRLPSGRRLAFEEAGNPRSDTVVLQFHDSFDVGTITRIPPILQEKDVHVIAPTLPGWGNTSLPSKSSSYVECIIADATALLTHLHPKAPNMKLYLVGDEFGSIAAQILHAAPYELFPLGRHIKAMLLIQPFPVPGVPAAGFSLRAHRPIIPPEYSSPIAMWMVRIILWPFFLSTKRTAWLFRRLFINASDVDRPKFDQWRMSRGVEDGQFEHEQAERVQRSIANGWQGHHSMPTVFTPAAQWAGYRPLTLGTEHAKVPVLIVSTKMRAMTQYLVENHKNVNTIYVNSELEARTWREDEVWSRLFAMA